MEYGPAPESDKEALAWLGKHERVFGHYIGGEWTEPGELFDVMNPATSKVIARVTNGSSADVDAAVAAAQARAAEVEGARAARARAIPVRARARRAEALAPARRAREHGQRQVDSRDARHRRAARRAALLSSRRLGAAARRGVPRLRGDRRRRPDHSVELPAADARVEDRAGDRRGKHDRAQAGRVHAAHGACASRRSRTKRAFRRA